MGKFALWDSVSYPSLSTSNWTFLVKVIGSNPSVVVPCYKAPTSVSVSSAQIFFEGEWTDLTFSTYEWFGCMLKLKFTESLSYTDGYSYLARMNLSVS